MSLLAILPGGNTYGIPMMFVETIFFGTKFKKVSGEFFEDGWMAYNKDEFSIKKVGIFTYTDIASNIEYDKNTNLEELVKRKTKSYLKEQQDQKDKEDLIEKWDGAMYVKSRRNNKLGKIL